MVRKKIKIKKSKADKIMSCLAYLFIGFIALACFIPLIMVVSVSVSNNTEVLQKGYSILPRAFTLDTYIYLFAHSGVRILRSYIVTIFVTVVGCVTAMIITSMCSFALSIKTLKYRNVIAYFCNLTIIFSAGLIPWYYVCVNWYGFSNNFRALIVPQIVNVFNMFLLRTYFEQVPVSLYDSARIDGAGYFKIWMSIAVPLTKTGMMTVGMMFALSYWNDWWNALMFVDDRDFFPLQYYLYNILSNVNAISSGRIPAGAAANIALPSETVKMAVTIVTIGPIIFLYPFVQKYFVNGIMTGAVKE
ncbi:carbohydrate ABC transporter permease [Butyrivibrio sp. NC3005]|uniref:carbohydrate ABC transporter permease n=1 Tax=Butyrivibrio sp. NC3005 TaxID=1280685 RepID=UPI000410B909|nr:carbohydrate ABC transporter permease [Butyrivibrio sp. NC3005]